MVKKNYFLKKIWLFVFTSLFLALPTFGQRVFSGYAGAAGSLQNGTGEKKVVANLDAFFAGQFNFGSIFQFRTVASLKTLNLTKQFLFTDIESLVSIDEISLAATFHGGDLTHHIALFGGEYESIGSDVFLQRHFGIAPIASRITGTWKGLMGSVMYPRKNMGLSYTMRFSQPHAVSTYMYLNQAVDLSQLNFDLRYAGLFKYATIDLAAGLNIPFENQESNGDKVILLVRHVDMHASGTMLFKTGRYFSLFLQAGINRLRFNPEEGDKMLKLEDVHFLFEPRFDFGAISMDISLFNMPKTFTEDTFFIDYPFGFNLAIYKENISVGSSVFTAGSHITLSVIDKDLATLKGIKFSDVSLMFSPFFEVGLSRGVLKIAGKIDLLQIVSEHQNICLNIGYTVQL